MGTSDERVLVLDGIKAGLECVSDDIWVSTSTLHSTTTPIVKVTQPEGSFCQLDSRFFVPLPPDDVYEIIIDPNNRRVFKNVKDVIYRKVLEDDGNCQLVEVEQLARWKFLVFSGTFSVRVLVKQNRQEHSMQYDLAQEGMMKKFVGSWKIDPTYGADAEPSNSKSASEEQGSSPSETGKGTIGAKGRLTGSWVTLQQSVQPAFIPPWPLTGYVRGVCCKIILDVCSDLQLEAIRLAGVKSLADKEKNSDMNEVD